MKSPIELRTKTTMIDKMLASSSNRIGFLRFVWLMTHGTLLGSVGLFLIPQKMDEDSCSQQDADSFLVLDQQSSQPGKRSTTSISWPWHCNLSWLTIRGWNDFFPKVDMANGYLNLPFPIDQLTWNKTGLSADWLVDLLSWCRPDRFLHTYLLNQVREDLFYGNGHMILPWISFVCLESFLKSGQTKFSHS